MSSIDEIKSRIDIVDLVSESVKLRHSGKNYTGFCPFHSNTRTPSFAVFPDSGTWRCFGQCNEGGDIFKFVMKKEGWDFSQTLKFLAEKTGVKLEARSPEQEAAEEEHNHLRELLEDSVTFYRHQLLHTPAGAPALDYLKKRGLKPETLEIFGLGYSPDSWEAVIQHLTAKGYTRDELIQTGMVTERQGGEGIHDRFRNRIMIPIRDGMGKMSGFGARILDPNDVPKFLNSPQTVLFDKGKLLYGLDQARKSIRAKDQAVIVEGYLDVIVLHQQGYPNAVSPMGTALTDDQLRMLKRFTRNIVLALDADAAGEKATLRGLDLTRQAMDHSQELTFDAHGLLRHEARLQADVRVTMIPAGKDPDEVALANSEEWGRIVEAARPVVVHVMETLAQGRDLEDAKVKREIAAQVKPLIEDVADPVERDAYRQRLARLLKVDERALVGGASAPARRQKRQVIPQTQAVTPSAVSKPAGQFESGMAARERGILSLLLHEPELLYPLNRHLQGCALPALTIQDLEDSSNQALARLLLEGMEQTEVDLEEYITSNLPEVLEPLHHDLTKVQDHTEPMLLKRLEDLARQVIRLRYDRVTLAVTELRFQQEELQQQGESGFAAYQEMSQQYAYLRLRLDQALAKPVLTD
jgi:DNA primase